MIEFPRFMELSGGIDGVEFYFDIYTRIEACNQQSGPGYSFHPQYKLAAAWRLFNRCRLQK